VYVVEVVWKKQGPEGGPENRVVLQDQQVSGLFLPLRLFHKPGKERTVFASSRE
jgi:hypothetical protein